MITAEEAKRIADDARLKEKSKAEANVDCYLSTLYEIIKDAANRGQYAITIELGSKICEDIYLIAYKKDNTIPISLEYLVKNLHDKGFHTEIGRVIFNPVYIMISWKG